VVDEDLTPSFDIVSRNSDMRLSDFLRIYSAFDLLFLCTVFTRFRSVSILGLFFRSKVSKEIDLDDVWFSRFSKCIIAWHEDGLGDLLPLDDS
jgi:hypothetical protein